jgi:hypothetical protein
LLLNALGIHYQLADSSVNLLATAFSSLFVVDEDMNTVAVQDFILFTDIFSIPELLLSIEAGQKSRAKLEDELLAEGILEIPDISKYELLKASCKVRIPCSKGDDTLMWKLFSLNLIGFEGFQFSEEGDLCTVRFQNTVDSILIERFLSSIFDMQKGQEPVKKSSFFKYQ